MVASYRLDLLQWPVGGDVRPLGGKPPRRWEVAACRAHQINRVINTHLHVAMLDERRPLYHKAWGSIFAMGSHSGEIKNLLSSQLQGDSSELAESFSVC